MRLWIIVAAALALEACTPASDTFRCESSDQCSVTGDAGRCEVTGMCSLADPTCDTGWRLVSPGAGTASGQCVPNIAGASSVDAGAWPVSATPSNTTGPDPTFDLLFSDGSGAATLKGGGVLINRSVNGVQACWLFFDRTQGALFLADDDETQWASVIPGAAGQLSNSQCSIDGRLSSVVVNGNYLLVTVSVRFSPAFTGTRNLYLYAADVAGQSSPYVLMGTWSP